MRHDTIIQKTDVLAVPTEDAILFMDVRSGQYLMLQDTAREIWTLIDGARSVADIAQQLTQTFEIDLPTCRDQVLDFVKRLHARGMVEAIRLD